jgi:hypothetical protein
MSEIRDNTYPLTAAQSGMWFAQFLDPTNPSLRVAECLEIHGPIDPVLFKGSSAPVEQPLPRRTSTPAATAGQSPPRPPSPSPCPGPPGSARTPAPPPRKKAREDAPS